eukprot:TRINITY_DN74743_c0_g1_i1.p1 TRINITY_DN74743_c0_g1~~TRINITY_DN74743_c0_g1_i1.p1  ORF type:complete len:221 (+),score=28.69 TRINITY_DN74743_c0_g1_i1:65-727(+)
MAPTLSGRFFDHDSGLVLLPPVNTQMRIHHVDDHRQKVRRSISAPFLPPIVSDTLGSESSNARQESCSTSKRSTHQAAIWLDNQTKGSSKDRSLGRERQTALLASNGDWAEMQSALQQRRRTLRKDFQGRGGGSLTATDVKRRLVPGLVSMKEAPQHLAKEKNKTDGHKQRIQEAIRHCSNSRMEVVDLQRTMAAMAIHEDVKNGLSEKVRNLAKMHHEN